MSIWIITSNANNSVTNSTILVNTNSKWIKRSFIRVYINNRCSSLTWLIITKGAHLISPLELKANDALKLPIVQTLNNPINIC